MTAALSALLLAGVLVTPDNISNLDPGSLVGHSALKLFRTVDISFLDKHAFERIGVAYLV